MYDVCLRLFTNIKHYLNVCYSISVRVCVRMYSHYVWRNVYDMYAHSVRHGIGMCVRIVIDSVCVVIAD